MEKIGPNPGQRQRGFGGAPYHPPSGHLLSLDTEATGLHEREAQLSRLTAWVLQAHEKNHRWELRLPSGTHIATDSGPLHMQRCLQALALEP